MKAKYGDATEHALPLVSSLGFLIIFEHLVISQWGSDPLQIESPFGDATFTIGTLIFSYPQIISLVLSLGIVFLLSHVIRRTKLGRALRSIAERPDTATLMGVDVLRIVPVVYVITGLLCAISGILFTINYTSIDAYIGDTVATVAIAGILFCFYFMSTRLGLALRSIQSAADLEADRFDLLAWENPDTADGPAAPFWIQSAMAEAVVDPKAEPLVAQVAADGGAVEGLRLAGGDLVLKIECAGAVVQIRVRGSAPFPEGGGIDIRHRYSVRMPPTMGRMLDFWNAAGLPTPRQGRGRWARIGLS